MLKLQCPALDFLFEHGTLNFEPGICGHARMPEKLFTVACRLRAKSVAS